MEHFYKNKLERRTGEVVKQDFDVYDLEGTLRFVTSITILDSDGDTYLEDFTISNNGQHFNILDRMGLEKGSIKIKYIAPKHAYAGEDSIAIPFPNSPINLLICIHELSHVAQSREFAIETKNVLSIREILFVIGILSRQHIKLAASEIVDEVKSFDRMYAKTLVIPDKEEILSSIKALNRDWEKYALAHSEIGKLLKLYEPLIEQDAHSRTNELLDEIEYDLDINFDFKIRNDEKLTLHDDVNKNLYDRAFRVLNMRKASQAFGGPLTTLALCQEMGIEIALEDLPEDLQMAINKDDFQQALQSVRMKMKGFN